MRMSGSWHIYRPGERWQRPPRDMRIVVGDRGVRRGRVQHPGRGVRLVTYRCSATSTSAASDPICLRRLPIWTRRCGVCGRAPARSLRRCCSLSAWSAGIGNVFKSETLFLCGIDPVRARGGPHRRSVARTPHHGSTPAPGQRPRQLHRGHRHLLRPEAHDRPRRSDRSALGLWPPRQALPALRHTDRVSKTGPGCPPDLLVPEVPERAWGMRA